MNIWLVSRIRSANEHLIHMNELVDERYGEEYDENNANRDRYEDET